MSFEHLLRYVRFKIRDRLESRSASVVEMTLGTFVENVGQRLSSCRLHGRQCVYKEADTFSQYNQSIR